MTALAACRHYDPAMWFPAWGDMGTAYEAKQVCRRCPLQQSCFTDAVARNEEFGIWGGVSFGNHRAKGKRRELAREMSQA